MTTYPYRTRAAVATALFAGVSLLAACNGLSSTPPANGNQGTPTAAPATPSVPASAAPTTKPSSAPTAKPTTKPTTPPTTAPTSTPTTAPQQACTVPAARIPGTYTSLLIAGNLSGGTLTLSANSPSLWTRLSYTAATPTPVPTISPTTEPTTSPSPGPPLYVYFGTYTVTHNAKTEPTGCAVLITTQNGSPLTGQSVNSDVSGSPNLQGPFTTTLVATGSVTALSLTNLTASGGNGTFSLSDGSTGTLAFTSRVSVAEGAALAKLRK